MKLDRYTKKTLRWFEPFGGWKQENVNHDYFSVNLSINDTGLCNRLLHWEIAHFLNEKNNFEYNIFVQEKDWPELCLINLPNTYAQKNSNIEDSFFSRRHENLQFRTVFDVERDIVYSATEIDRKTINNMFKTNNFKLENEHYYSNFGYSPLYKKLILNETLKSKWESKKFARPLTKVRLLHSALEEAMRWKLKKAVGIHIRRFNGVTSDDLALNTLKDSNLKKIYKDLEPLKTVNKNYEFFGDDVYFYLIDRILQINPNQDIYISHDLPDVFLEPYVNRFGKNIIEKKYFIEQTASILTNQGMNVEVLRRNGNPLANIIDLFSLSYCPFLIKSPESTWSEFAEYYNNPKGLKHITYVNYEPKNIISEFNSFYNGVKLI